jgi:lysophospholipase L1-like esterase
MIRHLVLFTLLCSFALPQQKKITVWLVGDSTMSKKEIKAYPETGWGMPFAGFFDSTVEVQNHAKNGRSTKSFRAEGLWQPVMDKLSEGDYVFIQFGHNDEGKEKVGRYTTPEEFKANLIRYVAETQLKKATPVLLTPVSRRSFDSTGKIRQTHPVYSDVVRAVAKQMNVRLIDLDELSRTFFQQQGPEASRLFFNHLAPNEHPNYPEGKKDDTHFNELGARVMAQIVLKEIRNLGLDLSKHIIQPPQKK